MRHPLLTGAEVADAQERLWIAVTELERIRAFIDNTSPHNAQFAVDVVRGMVINAQERIVSPLMYGEDDDFECSTCHTHWDQHDREDLCCACIAARRRRVRG